jgi:hypothetical protein
MVDPGPMNDAVLGAFGESDQAVTVGGVAVEAIYDSRHYAVEAGEAGGSSLVTAISLRAAVAATIAIGTTPIVARGVAYRAKDKRPDSAGWVVVELERAP